MASAGVSAMKNPRERRLGVTGLRVLGVIILWSCWELAALSGLFYERVVPSSFLIVRSLLRQLADGTFYLHLAVTSAEIASALAIGAITGVAVGIAVGYSRLLSLALEPIIYYLAPTPKIVLLPILLSMVLEEDRQPRAQSFPDLPVVWETRTEGFEKSEA